MGYLPTDERLLIVGLEHGVLSRVRVEDLLLWLHLTTDVHVLNSPQVPLSILTHQQEVSRLCAYLLLDDWVCGQVALHQGHTQTVRGADEFACHFRFPQEQFSILSEGFLDVVPPEFAFSLEVVIVHVIEVVPGGIISEFLNIVNGSLLNEVLIDFFQHFLVVDLDEHSFAHADTGHDQGVLLNVFDEDKLAFTQ